MTQKDSYQVQKRTVTNSSRIAKLEYNGYPLAYDGVLIVTFKKGGRYRYILPTKVIGKLLSTEEGLGKVFQAEGLNREYKGEKLK